MKSHEPLSILVLGASYGMLPAVKLACAGHRVTLVGRDVEISKMADSGLTLHLPLRRSGQQIILQASTAEHAVPFHPALRTPEAADVDMADFVILAMQEPQYAAPEISALMARIGRADRPCLSIMNLPPPPFLQRLGSVPRAAYAGVYTDLAAWNELRPARLTLASPDPQALRLDPALPGDLTVTLVSNFKAAPFEDTVDQAKLELLAHDMSHLKCESENNVVRAPVALLAKKSLYVPLVKWPMLLAGNCRCLHPDGVLSIAEAVARDPAASRAIYDTVVALIVDLGTPIEEVVSFDTYAYAAAQLSRGSSMARGLAQGMIAVERIDRLVLNLLAHTGHDTRFVEPIVEQIDNAIARNKRRLALSN